MDTYRSWIIALADAASVTAASIGNKAANLARLARVGYRVPSGFCLTTAAYQRFVREQELAPVIQMELRRKPMQTLRWEELWDVALRIRSAFLAAEIDDDLSYAIESAAAGLPPGKAWAVRSSAPGEDSSLRSFAGLHESVVGVRGTQELLDAIRKVWASLWSDAALLYGHEISLDPSGSSMAVLVQEMVDQSPSGVAFARDPRDRRSPYAVVEAVPGRCGDLVDGTVEPDRWFVHRESGAILEWRAGRRGQEDEMEPLLPPNALDDLLRTLLHIEAFFGWEPDLEWTGHSECLTILQARPITWGEPDREDPRRWYLSLKLGGKALKRLAALVTETRIPQLVADCDRLGHEALEALDDGQLADNICRRLTLLHHWREIYRDEFIPFADGVRQLGHYYNDAIGPADPYEFVGLLEGQSMLATQRNHEFMALSAFIRSQPELKSALEGCFAAGESAVVWTKLRQSLTSLAGGSEFLRRLGSLLLEHMDIVYGETRLGEHPELIVATVLQLAPASQRMDDPQDPGTARGLQIQDLEKRLFEAVGEARREEASDILRIGRLSWQLRDDDNLLVSRLESQLFRALRAGTERLIGAGRLPITALERVREDAATPLVEALRDPAVALSEWFAVELPQQSRELRSQEIPRQLIGQPAAPGVASGPVCRVRNARDLGRFRRGCVLVCDAIQPMMTHVVPLATGIIERRGGMLIHGAIIARELRIPCVNGIDRAIELFTEDQWVTVDGHLGIVTVGRAEFDLEMRQA